MNMADFKIKFKIPILKAVFLKILVFTETKSLNNDSEVTEHDNELKFGSLTVKYIMHVHTEAFCN